MDEWVNVLFVVVIAVLYIVGGLVKSLSNKGAQQKRQGLAKEHRQQRQESWQQRLMRKAEEMQRLAAAKQKELADRSSSGGRQERQPRPPSKPGEQPGLDGLSFRQGRGGEAEMVYDAGEARRDIRRPQQASTPPPPPGGRRVVRPRPVTPARPQTPPTPRQDRPRGRLRSAREAIRVARSREAAPRPPAEAQPELTPPEKTPLVSGLPKTTLGSSRARRRTGRTGPIVAASQRPDVLIDYSDPQALRRAIVQYEILGKPLSLRDSVQRTTLF
jgi:hypothetical protein